MYPIKQFLGESRDSPNTQIGFSNIGVNHVSLRFGSHTHPGSDQLRDKVSFKDKDYYREKQI